MPHYSTRTLLLVFGLVAIWLGTFAGLGASQDIRRSMLLLGLVAASCLAIFSRGKRRVFWTGFAVTMFLCGGLSIDRPLHRYVPAFAWQQDVVPAVSRYGALRPAAVIQKSAVSLGVNDTMTAGWTLALSALAGFVASSIYSRTRPAYGDAYQSAMQIVEQELHDLR
jgi:hypothetical protein